MHAKVKATIERDYITWCLCKALKYWQNIFLLKKIPALVFSSIVQWPWRCVFLRVFDLLIPNSLTYASDVNLDAPLSIFKFKSLTVISARAFKNIYLSPGDAQKSNHHIRIITSLITQIRRAIVFIIIGCEFGRTPFGIGNQKVNEPNNQYLFLVKSNQILN